MERIASEAVEPQSYLLRGDLLFLLKLLFGGRTLVQFLFIFALITQIYYASSFVAYRQQRLRQTGLTEFIDQHLKNVWQDMDKEIKKRKRRRRTIVKRRALNQVQVLSFAQLVMRLRRQEKTESTYAATRATSISATSTVKTTETSTIST